MLSLPGRTDARRHAIDSEIATKMDYGIVKNRSAYCHRQERAISVAEFSFRVASIEPDEWVRNMERE